MTSTERKHLISELKLADASLSTSNPDSGIDLKALAAKVAEVEKRVIQPKITRDSPKPQSTFQQQRWKPAIPTQSSRAAPMPSTPLAFSSRAIGKPPSRPAPMPPSETQAHQTRAVTEGRVEAGVVVKNWTQIHSSFKFLNSIFGKGNRPSESTLKSSVDQLETFVSSLLADPSLVTPENLKALHQMAPELQNLSRNERFLTMLAKDSELERKFFQLTQAVQLLSRATTTNVSLQKSLELTDGERKLFNRFSKNPEEIGSDPKLRKQLDTIAMKLVLAGTILPEGPKRTAAMKDAGTFFRDHATFGELTDSVRENPYLLRHLLCAFPEKPPAEKGIPKGEKNALISWLQGNRPHFADAKEMASHFFSVCITATKLEQLLGVSRVFFPLVDASPATEDMIEVLRNDPSVASIAADLRRTVDSMAKETNPIKLKELIYEYQKLKKNLDATVSTKFPVLKNFENFGKALQRKISLEICGNDAALKEAKKKLLASPWGTSVLQGGKTYLSTLARMASKDRPEGKDRQQGLRDAFTQSLRNSGCLNPTESLSDEDFDLCLEFLKGSVDSSELSPIAASIQKTERKSAEEFRSKLCGLYVWTSKQIEYLTKAIAQLEKANPSSAALPHLRQALAKFETHRRMILEKLSPDSRDLISVVESANPEDVQNVQTIFTHDSKLGGIESHSPATELFSATCQLALESGNLILRDALPLLPQEMKGSFSTPFSRALTSATLILADVAKLCPNATDAKILEGQARRVADQASSLNTELREAEAASRKTT